MGDAVERRARADDILIGFLVAVIVTVVALAALNALDMDDTERQPIVPASVYQHPEEEP